MLLLFYFVLAPGKVSVLHCAQQELCRGKRSRRRQCHRLRKSDRLRTGGTVGTASIDLRSMSWVSDRPTTWTPSS